MLFACIISHNDSDVPTKCHSSICHRKQLAQTKGTRVIYDKSRCNNIDDCQVLVLLYSSFIT